MGDRYPGDLSRHAAKSAIKNSGQLLPSPPQSSPSAIMLVQVQAGLRALFPSQSSLSDFITTLSIFSPTPPPGSLLQFPHFHFLLPPLHVFFFFFSPCQTERDLTLINKFHLP